MRTPLVEPPPGRFPEPTLVLRGRHFDLSRRVLVMGIVNRTPDSFWDGGTTTALDAAVGRALSLVEEGADLVDIGGVSARQGEAVSPDEELDRVVPVVERVRDESDVALSVDTWRAEVAEAALEAGADLVNDVTGAHEPDILDVVARYGGAYVAMHGGPPKTYPFRVGYRPDVVTAAVAHCRELADRAVAAGIAPASVIVDPGHDFMKTTHHSLALSRHLEEFAALGHAVLVALSNKSFIGETLGVGLDERPAGNAAAEAFSVLRGANILRVHDVGATVRTVRMLEALLGWRGPARPTRGLQ
ncbi:MAG: dihydropteroate synthase [Nitriliruptorales bacterium]